MTLLTKLIFPCFAALLIVLSCPIFAKDFYREAHYADGDVIPEIWTIADGTVAPKYALIMMPGGNGIMDITQGDDGNPRFKMGGNFLIRSRALFADSQTVIISVDKWRSEKRMRAIVAGITAQYPTIQIYIIGTSRSTQVTTDLAQSMDGKVAGFIHTSSMPQVQGIDGPHLKSRNLIVSHENEGCKTTPRYASVDAHERYGTQLITITGGISEGDPCGAYAYHGYNGVEKETVEKIKQWIKQGASQL